MLGQSQNLEVLRKAHGLKLPNIGANCLKYDLAICLNSIANSDHAAVARASLTHARLVAGVLSCHMAFTAHRVMLADAEGGPKAATPQSLSKSVG